VRIESLNVVNAMPVLRFEADALADVVVIAGPNGVGKTRLLARIMQMLRGDPPNAQASASIHATNEVESGSWGKGSLDLADPADVNLYRATLQANRRRRNLRSSVLQFESNRSIQSIQPLQFTWDMPDPTDEEVGWDTGFGFWQNRWQDTVHSMYRLIEHQKQSIANRAVQLRRQGHEEMKLEFSDPMDPFKDVFAQLLAPKALVEPTARRQSLEFTVGDQVFDISQLSSGEREVVNIGFDFLLRNPTDSIVFFDEPELHLHPELSHRLIQVLQGIGERNQFVLSTHSPDVIAGSLDKSVIFISPPRSEDGQPANQAIAVSEDDETNQALKLLGHSIGIISLGRKIVLIEGEHSSLDKEVYGTLLRGRYPDLVLVPSGGKHVIESFDTLQSAVLQRSIWGVEFFMLCDRDSRPSGSPGDSSESRFRILPRYHLENYFLDEFVLAHAFSRLEPADSWLRNPHQIRQKLRDLGRGLVSYSVALSVAADIRLESGNVSIMPKECNGLSLADLAKALLEKAAAEDHRVDAVLKPEHVEALAAAHYGELTASLDADDDNWLNLLPGKPLFAQFAATSKLQPSRLKTAYLDAAPETGRKPFAEILEVFAHFASM